MLRAQTYWARPSAWSDAQLREALLEAGYQPVGKVRHQYESEFPRPATLGGLPYDLGILKGGNVAKLRDVENARWTFQLHEVEGAVEELWHDLTQGQITMPKDRKTAIVMLVMMLGMQHRMDPVITELFSRNSRLILSRHEPLKDTIADLQRQ